MSKMRVKMYRHFIARFPLTHQFLFFVYLACFHNVSPLWVQIVPFDLDHLRFYFRVLVLLCTPFMIMFCLSSSTLSVVFLRGLYFLWSQAVRKCGQSTTTFERTLMGNSRKHFEDKQKIMVTNLSKTKSSEQNTDWTYYPKFVTSNFQLPTVICQLPAFNSLVPSAYWQLSSANFLLPTANF